MGELLKFSLATTHEQNSIYVPLDTTWAKLKSLCFGFFNVDYSLKMESIKIIDANNMNAVIDNWTSDHFSFQKLDLTVPGQDLVFIIHTEGAVERLPSPPPRIQSNDTSIFTPSLPSSSIADLLATPLSSSIGAELTSAELEFSSPLMIMNNFDKDTFKKLVSHEVPLDKSFDVEQKSDFLKCCANADTTHLEALFKDQDSIKLSVEGGQGVFLASSLGHLSVVELLHREGVALDEKHPTWKLTPLNIACLRNHEALAKWLIEKNCKLTKNNDFGATPLHYICYHEMSSLLPVIVNSNVDTVSGGGFSLCHYATGIGSFPFVEHLLKLGADVNCWDNYGNYPLHYAAAAGVLESVFLLVDVGKCPVDCVNENGQTPFLVACRSGHVEIAKWLASSKAGTSTRGGGGANVFIEDQRYGNALHAATQSGHLDLIAFVCSLGLSLAAKTKDGKLPIDLTTDTKVIELLKKIEAERYVEEENLKKSKELEKEKPPRATVSTPERKSKRMSKSRSVNLPSTSSRIKKSHANELKQQQSATSSINSEENLSVQEVEQQAELHPDPQVNQFFKSCCNGDKDYVSWYISQKYDIFICNDKGSQAIHFAVQGGHLNIVQMLFQAGADLEAYNNKGIQPMAIACSKLKPNEYSLVKWLTSQGVDVFATGDDVDYAKHGMYFVACCSFDCADLIEFLYHSCPLVKYYVKQMNKSDKVEWSMLHSAAEHGTVSNVEAFLDIGMRFGPRLKSSLQTPLHCAVLRNDPDVELVAFILQNCSHDDVVATDSRGRTAIFLACLLGHMEMAMCIADAGFNSISITNIAGNTCLHAACQGGNNRLVLWLEEKYPDLNIRNNDGAYPNDFTVQVTNNADTNDMTDPEMLLEGFRTGNVTMLKKLSSVYDLADEVLGVDPDDEGECPFLHALVARGFLNAVVYLVEQGASLEALDSKGWTPLHYAVVNGQVDIMHYFVLQQHVNIFTTCGDDGSTCLHLAVRGYSMESATAVELFTRINMATELIDLGLDVNCQDVDGNTPAHLAARCLWLDMMLLLEDHGADLHMKNGDMMSVVHEIVEGAGQREKGYAVADVEPILDQLLSFGCDIDIRGRNNLTSFHLACVNGNVSMCNQLFERGSNIRLLGGKNNLTAVHMAAMKGHLPVVEWLISQGMRHDSISGENNKTPAEVAYAAGNHDIYDWLMTTAPTVYEDRFSECLLGQLFWAIDLEFFGLASSVLEEIIECGPSLDICTEEGSNLIHAAAAVGNSVSLQDVFCRGVGLEATTSNDHTALHIACLHDRISCVKVLIDLGADVNAIDVDGNTCLHIAVEKDNIDIAKIFCNIYKDIEIQNMNGWTPLHCCCCQGNNVEMLNLLLQQEVNIFRYSFDEQTPFYMACEYGHCKFVHDMMVYLLTERVLISEENLNNAMSIAYENGHTNIVQWLEQLQVENGEVQAPLPDASLLLIQMPTELDEMPSDIQRAHISSTSPANNLEVFLEAIENEDFAFVNALLKSGVDANSVNPENKMTAMHIACLTGNLLLVQLLAEYGADLNPQNMGGLTPLHIACDRQHKDIVMFLLEMNASLLKVCNNGNTVLHMMASRSLCDAIYELKNYKKHNLCNAGARNSLGQEALHLAVVAGSIDTCEALLALGCPIDGTDCEGVTPLLLACSIDLSALVTLLVARGANVNHSDNHQRRPLHAACITGNMLVAHTLIDSGAVVSCETDSGDTVLHSCAKNGKLLLLKWLLKFGLNLKQKNLSGETPRDCAVAADYGKIVEWIDSQ